MRLVAKSGCAPWPGRWPGPGTAACFLTAAEARGLIGAGRPVIRVNSICPTFIRRPLAEATFSDPAQMERVKGQIRLGRTGAAPDIMGAVLYLASEASALVTGTSLMVDGGWTAG